MHKLILQPAVFVAREELGRQLERLAQFEVFLALCVAINDEAISGSPGIGSVVKLLRGGRRLSQAVSLELDLDRDTGCVGILGFGRVAIPSLGLVAVRHDFELGLGALLGGTVLVAGVVDAQSDGASVVAVHQAELRIVGAGVSVGAFEDQLVVDPAV